MPITTNQLFFYCCVENKIDDLLILLKTHNVDIHYKNEDAFISACRNGHYEVVRILTTIYKKDRRYNYININACNEAAFKYACAYGHIKIIRYITSLYRIDSNYDKINIHAGDECGFKNAIKYMNFGVLSYILKLYRKPGYKPLNIIYEKSDNMRINLYFANLGQVAPHIKFKFII